MPLEPIGLLVTPRLLTRPLDDADLDELAAINGDPDVTRFLPYAAWQSPADAQAWLARTRSAEAAGTAQQLVAVSRADGRVVGSILLFRHEEASGRIELGYVLGRNHWRRGLMREALQAVCDHLFAALAMRRIEAQVNPDNAASNALLQALGFRFEGRLRQRWVNQGVPVDTCFYGLLASEWPPRLAPAHDALQAGAAPPGDCTAGVTPVALEAAAVTPRARPSFYPEPLASRMAGREKRALGDRFGLRNFGVNLTRLAPGAVSALRHAHDRQDEFIFVLQGHPTLQTDAGTTHLSPGMCAGFRAASGDAHRLLNEATEDVVYLEIGDHTPGDRVSYPDDDLQARLVDGRWQFTHRDGTPYD